MTDTVPHRMINALTGEEHFIQLKPKGGMTAAEAQDYLADRVAEGKRIDPHSCEIIKDYAKAVDIYGIYEVPDEWSCGGRELFVRNLPDGHWVWFGDLPEETCRALLAQIEARRTAAEQ